MFDQYEEYFQNTGDTLKKASFRKLDITHTHKHSSGPLPPSPLSVTKKIGNYYEWNAVLSKWDKLIENIPDPSPEWPNGTYDGEIKKF